MDELTDHNVVHVVDHPDLGRGSPDTENIAFCAGEDHRLVTNDWQIRQRPHEKAALHELQVGAYFFYLGKSKSPDFWKIVRIFTKYWLEVEGHAQRNDPPFTMRVHKTRGISTL